MREFRSLTTDVAVLYLKQFIMNSKTRSRKISLFKAYLRAILHYFGLLPLPGWQRRMDSGMEAESFVIRYS